MLLKESGNLPVAIVRPSIGKNLFYYRFCFNSIMHEEHEVLFKYIINFQLSIQFFLNILSTDIFNTNFLLLLKSLTKKVK